MCYAESELITGSHTTSTTNSVGVIYGVVKFDYERETFLTTNFMPNPDHAIACAVLVTVRFCSIWSFLTFSMQFLFAFLFSFNHTVEFLYVWIDQVSHPHHQSLISFIFIKMFLLGVLIVIWVMFLVDRHEIWLGKPPHHEHS